MFFLLSDFFNLPCVHSGVNLPCLRIRFYYPPLPHDNAHGDDGKQ